MNRPKIEDYLESPYRVNHKYVRKLEKYCDELEKTFNKACAYLHGMNGLSARQWKEYLSKDEC